METYSSKKRGRSMPHGGVANTDIALANGPDDNENNDADEPEKSDTFGQRSSSACCVSFTNVFRRGNKPQ